MVEILISNDIQNISNSHTVAIWFYGNSAKRDDLIG